MSTARTPLRPVTRIGRKRGRTGWTLLILGVLVTGVRFASRWWSVGYKSAGWRAGAGLGIV
ncbi:MAG TPA: hypothetical protein VEB22_08110 [Phycisphaerales bacterium]|nr:hypothetical protein [Phycisphaerales bacterium]